MSSSVDRVSAVGAPKEDVSSSIPSPSAGSEDIRSATSSMDNDSGHAYSDSDSLSDQGLFSDNLGPTSSSPILSSPTAAVTPPDNDFGGDVSASSSQHVVIVGEDIVSHSDGLVSVDMAEESPNADAITDSPKLQIIARMEESVRPVTTLISAASHSSGNSSETQEDNPDVSVNDTQRHSSVATLSDDVPHPNPPDVDHGITRDDAVAETVPSSSQGSFLSRVDVLLLAVQQERRQAEFRQRFAKHPTKSGSEASRGSPTIDRSDGLSSRTNAVSPRPIRQLRGAFAMSSQCRPLMRPVPVPASVYKPENVYASTRASYTDCPRHDSQPASVFGSHSCGRSQNTQLGSDIGSPMEVEDNIDEMYATSAGTYPQVQARASDLGVTGANSATSASPVLPRSEVADSPVNVRSVHTKKRQLSHREGPNDAGEDRNASSKRKADAYTQHSKSDQCEAERGRKRVRLSVESRFFKRKDSMHKRSKSPKEDGKTPTKRAYATVPASLRRAESLMSEASLYSEEKENIKPQGDSDEEAAVEATVCTSRPARAGSAPLSERGSSSNGTPTSFLTPGHDYISTAPATPIKPCSRRSRGRVNQSPAVPIIAPPPFEMIERAPLSADEAAEWRIAVMLRKECQQREEDGLGVAIAVIPAREADRVVGDEHDTKDTADAQVQAWRVGVEAGSDPAEANTDSDGNVRKECVFSRIPQLSLGIEEEMRREVVEWILEVVPETYPSKPQFCFHLRDQLMTSDETRFHAAYLFMRYFLRVGSSSESPKAPDTNMVLLSEGREAVTWDVAVACVALCVKFHRDALLPLYIILACEFLTIAPHDMSDDDFEASQRDVLETFSFSIGSVTPAAYMQELWLALPRLRKLLGFDNGWKVAQAEAWAMLLDALLQEDVLRFPVSLLTASALIDGTIESLTRRYMEDAFRMAGGVATSCQCRQFRKKAGKSASGVMLDIQEVLGHSTEDMTFCRQWLRSMV